MRRFAWAPLALLAAAGCTSQTIRPPAMAEANRLGQAPSLQAAAQLAPEAYASARKLQRAAERSYRDGDLGAAQFLSENAIAAYEHALVLTRLARANVAAGQARASLAAAEQTLAHIEEEYQRITALSDDLEMRIKVVREAVPTAQVGPGTPARDQARLVASRSLALDAKLLCAAAKMLAPDVAGLAEAQASVDDLERRLSARPHPAPIESAMRTRAGCLSVLTVARRPAGATSSIGRADELLSQVSAMAAQIDPAQAELSPLRDERGVVVTLRGPALAQREAEQIRALGRVAQAHPEFPVQVVVHGRATSKDDLARQRAQGDRIARALVEAGARAERVQVQEAGTAHPLAAAGSASAAERNERTEIVFVDPGG